MKAFLRPQTRHTLLATLIFAVVLGGTLLPLIGAEAKSKKTTSKSASSATLKAKKSTPSPAGKKSKASPTPKSSPKKSTTPAAKKKSASKSTSGKSKPASTPAPKTEEPAGAEEKKVPEAAPEQSPPPTTPSSKGAQKPEIPGQPAPPLPQADPAASTEPVAPSVPAAPVPDTTATESKPMPASLTQPPTVPPPVPVPGGNAPENGSNGGGKGAPKIAPNVSLAADDLLGFEEQPPRVQQLITAALELSRQKLTYKYGSADPNNGGMDCSGAIHHLLTQQGFKDVPRDASGQYVWARKTGKFFAVVSKKADSFEFGDLLPGDLLFWNGTYNSDKDPPVTHTMIYLGVQRKRAQHVMWGSSDGRTYDGKPRWGVSVFDFKMPRADKNILDGAKADFLGYARIPGLRE